MSVPVKVFVDGNPSGKIFLSGWVDRYVNVVCAGRFLPRNTILGAGDLRWVRINISKAPKNLITDVEQAIGKRLKQSLKEGQPLRSNMIAVPPVIKRGDRVKIVAQRGGLKVETVGIAKGSGALGEQIKVMNITSRKTVVGRIKDASTVRVLF
ncbi:MAG: flagellar basal body P-ring formation protein FlgA [Deltaproteobacteria bacterium]|nr:flagellar basal body P-ring formation protein FlgA [Deltaproteobacteria bacterium]